MKKIAAEHGPESIALWKHGTGSRFFEHVMRAYGCVNKAAPSFAQCRGPRDIGYLLTYGTGLGSPEPTDIANTNCLVLIGTHLGENMHNTQVQEFAQAVGAQGAPSSWSTRATPWPRARRSTGCPSSPAPTWRSCSPG